MVDLTQAEIDAARRRGQRAQAEEPRAVAAKFDRRRRKIVVDLANGCVFAFPPDLAEGFDEASDEQLAAVEVLGLGSGLRWDELDVDLHIPSLLAGVFGTKAWLARQGGAARSPAKTAAARARRQGRPAEKGAGGVLIASGANRQPASHGLTSVTPQPAKPPMSRVATVAPETKAVAAMSASNASIGAPARRRTTTISL